MKKDTKPTIYKTLCDTCHKACEVPFKPNGKKPVFCDDCFRSMREVSSESKYLNKKDKTIFDTPDNFIAPKNLSPINDSSSKIMELKRELNSVNSKLDKLIDMIGKKLK